MRRYFNGFMVLMVFTGGAPLWLVLFLIGNDTVMWVVVTLVVLFWGGILAAFASEIGVAKTVLGIVLFLVIAAAVGNNRYASVADEIAYEENRARIHRH